MVYLHVSLTSITWALSSSEWASLLPSMLCVSSTRRWIRFPIPSPVWAEVGTRDTNVRGSLFSKNKAAFKPFIKIQWQQEIKVNIYNLDTWHYPCMQTYYQKTQLDHFHKLSIAEKLLPVVQTQQWWPWYALQTHPLYFSFVSLMWQQHLSLGSSSSHIICQPEGIQCTSVE